MNIAPIGFPIQGAASPEPAPLAASLPAFAMALESVAPAAPVLAKTDILGTVAPAIAPVNAGLGAVESALETAAAPRSTDLPEAAGSDQPLALPALLEASPSRQSARKQIGRAHV